jgi:hypothetical protein
MLFGSEEMQLTNILCVLLLETEATEMVPAGQQHVSKPQWRSRHVNSEQLATSRSPFSTSTAAYHRGSIIFLATDAVNLFLLLPLALLSRSSAVLFDRRPSSLFGVRHGSGLVGGGNSGGPPCRPRRPTRRDGTRILRHCAKEMTKGDRERKGKSANRCAKKPSGVSGPRNLENRRGRESTWKEA